MWHLQLHYLVLCQKNEKKRGQQGKKVRRKAASYCESSKLSFREKGTLTDMANDILDNAEDIWMFA